MCAAISFPTQHTDCESPLPRRAATLGHRFHSFIHSSARLLFSWPYSSFERGRDNTSDQSVSQVRRLPVTHLGIPFVILPSIFFGRLRAETLCPTPLPSPNIIDYYPSGGDPSHPPPSTLRRSVVDLKSSGAVRVRFFGTPNSVNLCILSSSSLWYIVEVALCYIKKNFFAFRGRFTVCFWRISECAPVFIRPFKKALRDNKISVGGQCAISKN